MGQVMKVKVPALVVAVAVGLILMASGCKGLESPDPCRGGCVVPLPTATQDDPPATMSPCIETGGKGPCTTLWLATDEMCHWWLVPTGHIMDASAVDLGVWRLEDGEECA
jgi:hypothetical protein